jgi:hypothetical protein
MAVNILELCAEVHEHRRAWRSALTQFDKSAH